MSKHKAKQGSWLLVLQVGTGQYFPPLPCHWPLGPGPLDDDGGLLSGVGVRLLCSEPPHGTAMGSHPKLDVTFYLLPYIVYL